MWKLRLLIVICLLFGIRGVGVAWTVLTQLDLYQEVGAAGPWWLRVILNAILGVLFLALAGGLWRRKKWAYRWLIPILIAYLVISLAWLAIFAQSTYDRGRLPSVGVTSVLGLGFVLWLRTRVRVLFGE